jgi:hypothetical protein
LYRDRHKCIAQKLEQVSHNGQKTHWHPREVNSYSNTAIIVTGGGGGGRTVIDRPGAGTFCAGLSAARGSFLVGFLYEMRQHFGGNSCEWLLGYYSKTAVLSDRPGAGTFGGIAAARGTFLWDSYTKCDSVGNNNAVRWLFYHSFSRHYLFSHSNFARFFAGRGKYRWPYHFYKDRKNGAKL